VSTVHFFAFTAVDSKVRVLDEMTLQHVGTTVSREFRDEMKMTTILKHAADKHSGSPLLAISRSL
jgi:hypothetical protein